MTALRTKGSVIRMFTKPKSKIINHPNQKLLNKRHAVRIYE